MTIDTNTLIESTAAAAREMLSEAVKGGNESAKLQNKVNEVRTGSYSAMLKLGYLFWQADAHTADKAAAFQTHWEAFKTDVRTNAGGIAVKLGCSKAKAVKGKPQEYKVPGNCSTAASVIGDALSFGVSFVDTDAKPLPFGKLRDALSEAKKARMLALLGKDAKLLHKRIEELREMASEYAQRFETIVKNDAGGEWTKRAIEGITAALESGIPLLMEVKAATEESKPESDAGETVAAESEKAEPKPRRARKTEAA